MKKNIMAYDPKKKCRVMSGIYDDETKVFERTIDHKEHYHRNMRGYCIQDTAHRDIIGCQTVIHYVSGDKSGAMNGKWISEFKDYRFVPEKQTNGHGTQFVMYTRNMRKEGDKNAEARTSPRIKPTGDRAKTPSFTQKTLGFESESRFDPRTLPDG